jgi:hypothetical protein
MFKNQLQEYFQKRKLPNPTYSYENMSTVSHLPEFVSTVTLHNGKSFAGKPASKKTLADQNAAEKALKYVHKHKDKLRVKNPDFKHLKELNKRVCIFILVDYDNIHNIEPLNYLCKNTKVILFSKENNPLLAKLESKKFEIEITDSTRKDAVDILLILYISRFVIQHETDDERTKHVFVVTNDHFGDTLVEVINKQGGFYGECPNFVQLESSRIPKELSSSNYHSCHTVNELLRELKTLSDHYDSKCH